MSHSITQRTEAITHLRLYDLVCDFKWWPQDPFRQVAHPTFDLVPDGWILASIVCQNFGTKTRELASVAKILLEREVGSLDVVLEHFAVPTSHAKGVMRGETGASSREAAREFWRLVCARETSQGQPVPDQVVQGFSYPIPGTSEFGSLFLRYRRPLAYPASIGSSSILFGFQHLQGSDSTDFVANSAVFFAGRFDCFRQLVAKLDQIPQGSEHHAQITHDIYSVLLSMCAYFVGVEGAENGTYDLQMTYSSWKSTYKSLSKRGNSVFETDKAFVSTREFLIRIGARMWVWLDEAVEWWTTVKHEQELLGSTNTRMMARFSQIFDPGHWRKDFPEHTHNPFLAIPRRPGSLKQELVDKLAERRRLRSEPSGGSA